MDLELGKVPFKEAIDFFQAKQPLPSGAYTDLIHAMHDRAFVLAGVTRQDILTDVQGLVQKALKDGVPLKEFQKQFAKAIEGKWIPTNKDGEENTAWRSRVIYETNMRTAYAAGRWSQLQTLKKTHPYWKYRHGDSRRPRPQHLAWDGQMLKADDPWWQSHYPPNGWGCRCFVDACDQVDLEDSGRQAPDQAPPDAMRKVKYGDREIEVPAGVDPGWGYAPGGQGAQGVLRALANGHPPMASQAWAEIGRAAVRQEAAAFRAWAEQVVQTQRGGHVSRVVGILDPEILTAVQEVGLEPASAAIEILEKDILHLMSPEKAQDGKTIPLASLLDLPHILDAPAAVLFDKREQNLLYVFDVDGDQRKGKFAVEIGLRTKVMESGRRAKRPLNRVVTAGLVDLPTLKDRHFYEVLKGTL